MESGSPALQADSLPSESEANCSFLNRILVGLPGGSVVKNLPSNAGDAGSTPRWGTNRLCSASLPACCKEDPAQAINLKKKKKLKKLQTRILLYYKVIKMV